MESRLDIFAADRTARVDWAINGYVEDHSADYAIPESDSLMSKLGSAFGQVERRSDCRLII